MTDVLLPALSEKFVVAMDEKAVLLAAPVAPMLVALPAPDKAPMEVRASTMLIGPELNAACENVVTPLPAPNGTVVEIPEKPMVST